MISESVIVCQVKPDDPTVVVEGKNVTLNWESCGGDDSETLLILSFKRQKPGSTVTEQIASRGATEGGFNMIAPFKDRKKYYARALQKLDIFNVQRNEEYVYTLTINYQTSGGAYLEVSFQVTVDVKG